MIFYKYNIYKYDILKYHIYKEISIGFIDKSCRFE